MKTEMTILPNGNYEKIVSVIQHQCHSNDYNMECIEYGYEIGKLYLKIEIGDPYEDGFSDSQLIKFCPFCGYSPNQTNCNLN
jgi:hypothetical protein